MGRDGPRSSWGKEELDRQMFTVDFLEYVERNGQHATLYSTEYGA